MAIFYLRRSEFTGTSLQSTTCKDACVQVNTNFLRGVKASKVKEMIVEGNRACAIVSYDMVSPKGKNTSFDVAEILSIKNEKIDPSDIFFDMVGFREFMAN